MDTKYRKADKYPEYHYLKGHEDKSRKLIKDLFDAAVKAECDENNHDKAMRLLGQALHVVQDYYSHNEPVDPSDHHDDTRYYKDEFEDAISASFLLVQSFQMATNMSPVN